MTAYTCLACGASIPPATAVIVGVDVAGYPGAHPDERAGLPGLRGQGAGDHQAGAR
jgi:hypothetical protein